MRGGRDRDPDCGERMRRQTRQGKTRRKRRRKTDTANPFHLSSFLPHQHLSHIVILANYDLTAHARGQNTNVSGLNTFLFVVTWVRHVVQSEWKQQRSLTFSFDWRTWKGNKCVRRATSLHGGFSHKSQLASGGMWQGFTAIPEGEVRRLCNYQSNWCFPRF